MVAIYCIRNTRSGKRYIGQTNNVKGRWAVHRHLLRKGNHSSVHLQRAWNKEPEAFVFEIVEECGESDLCAREEYYIREWSTLSTQHGYNQLSLQCGRVVYHEESRRRMSDKKKGVFDGAKNPRFGVKCPDNVRAATIAANSRSYRMRCPRGELTEIFGMKPFCRLHGLDPRGMFHLLKGTWKQYRGWTLYDAPASLSDAA